jgi:uncharacterized protein (TIGR02246 family)
MTTETTGKTRGLIEDYYAALAKGDSARLLELLHPDCVWTPPHSAPLEVTVGAEAIAEALGRKIVKQMFSLEVRRVVVDGEVAIVQQRLQATAKATGQAYDNQYCWVYVFRDGRIVEIEEYADTIVAGRAMGWL